MGCASQRAWVTTLALATEFPTIWRDANTPERERKRMLARLIADAAVRYRGGATMTLTLPRPLTAQQLRATHPDVREQTNALLDDYTDATSRTSSTSADCVPVPAMPSTHVKDAPSPPM